MNLQNGEYIIFQISQNRLIKIYGQSKTSIESLYLTTKAIIYDVITVKHVFKKNETKEEYINLSDINIVNGVPQIFVEDVVEDGKLGWRLQIFFKNTCIVWLISEYESKKALQKEKTFLINEIYKLLIGRPFLNGESVEEMVVSSAQEGIRKGSEIGRTVAGAAKAIPIVGDLASKVIGVGTGLIGGAIGGIAGVVSGVNNKKKLSTRESDLDLSADTNSKFQQIKCSGCHSLLSGYVGEKVCCPYCDTEQII